MSTTTSMSNNKMMANRSFIEEIDDEDVLKAISKMGAKSTKPESRRKALEAKQKILSLHRRHQQQAAARTEPKEENPSVEVEVEPPAPALEEPKVQEEALEDTTTAPDEPFRPPVVEDADVFDAIQAMKLKMPPDVRRVYTGIELSQKIEDSEILTPDAKAEDSPNDSTTKVLTSSSLHSDAQSDAEYAIEPEPSAQLRSPAHVIEFHDEGISTLGETSAKGPGQMERLKSRLTVKKKKKKKKRPTTILVPEESEQELEDAKEWELEDPELEPSGSGELQGSDNPKRRGLPKRETSPERLTIVEQTNQNGLEIGEYQQSLEVGTDGPLFEEHETILPPEESERIGNAMLGWLDKRATTDESLTGSLELDQAEDGSSLSLQEDQEWELWEAEKPKRRWIIRRDRSKPNPNAEDNEKSASIDSKKQDAEERLPKTAFEKRKSRWSVTRAQSGNVADAPLPDPNGAESLDFAVPDNEVWDGESQAGKPKRRWFVKQARSSKGLEEDKGDGDEQERGELETDGQGETPKRRWPIRRTQSGNFSDVPLPDKNGDDYHERAGIDGEVLGEAPKRRWPIRRTQSGNFSDVPLPDKNGDDYHERAGIDGEVLEAELPVEKSTRLWPIGRGRSSGNFSGVLLPDKNGNEELEESRLGDSSPKREGLAAAISKRMQRSRSSTNVSTRDGDDGVQKRENKREGDSTLDASERCWPRARAQSVGDKTEQDVAELVGELGDGIPAEKPARRWSSLRAHSRSFANDHGQKPTMDDDGRQEVDKSRQLWPVCLARSTDNLHVSVKSAEQNNGSSPGMEQIQGGDSTPDRASRRSILRRAQSTGNAADNKTEVKAGIYSSDDGRGAWELEETPSEKPRRSWVKSVRKLSCVLPSAQTGDDKAEQLPASTQHERSRSTTTVSSQKLAPENVERMRKLWLKEVTEVAKQQEQSRQAQKDTVLSYEHQPKTQPKSPGHMQRLKKRFLAKDEKSLLDAVQTTPVQVAGKPKSEERRSGPTPEGSVSLESAKSQRPFGSILSRSRTTGSQDSPKAKMQTEKRSAETRGGVPSLNEEQRKGLKQVLRLKKLLNKPKNPEAMGEPSKFLPSEYTVEAHSDPFSDSSLVRSSSRSTFNEYSQEDVLEKFDHIGYTDGSRYTENKQARQRAQGLKTGRVFRDDAASCDTDPTMAGRMGMDMPTSDASTVGLDSAYHTQQTEREPHPSLEFLHSVFFGRGLCQDNPLANYSGAATVMSEGKRNHPGVDRLLEYLEDVGSLCQQDGKCTRDEDGEDDGCSLYADESLQSLLTQSEQGDAPSVMGKARDRSITSTEASTVDDEHAGIWALPST